MGIISANTKVAEIIESDYRLLGVMTRLGISGSFGEKTLSELCQQHSLQTDTAILLCEVYSNPNSRPSAEVLRACSAADVLRYIRNSHNYYLNTAIDEMTASIERLIAPCSAGLQQVIRDFFRGYQNELKNHFEFEEGQVIPYVQGLLEGKHVNDFSIDLFEKNHSNIEEKLSDLRSIILKSLPHECDDAQRRRLLVLLFELHEDLHSHTFIEDSVLVPMVRLLENKGRRGCRSAHPEEEDSAGEELSAREKEILVSVAQGLINKEIADRHNISVNTVITHRKNISRKTGIKTVAGLTVYAILNNLIDLNSIE